MDIGRKIIYQLSTGNVLVDTGERTGSVIETTLDQDFQTYTALQGIQQSAVGVIQCDYGYQLNNFATYPFHIDITKNPIDETAIVWDTNNLLGASLVDVQASKIAQVMDLYNQTLLAGFTSNATGTPTTFKYDQSSQIDFLKVDNAIGKGKITFPTSEIVDANQVPVTFNDSTQYAQFLTDMQAFDEAQQTKLDTLCTQVKACTTVDQVNAILVSFS